MNVKALLVAAVLLCAVAAAAAVQPQAKHQKQQQLEKKVMSGAVDSQTKEIEVEQLKALLAQIDQDHGRSTPAPVLEKEAKGVLKTLEKGQKSSEESSEESSSAAAAEESSEESSSAAAAEESSEESSSAAAEESSEESSQKAAEPKSIAELHRQLAALMLKKTSGSVKGEELERVNTEIELLLQKIRKAQAIDTPKPEAPKNGTRNEVEKLTDLVLAHLTTLREGRGDFAALHAVDVEDLAVNLRTLADKADEYKGGRSACAEDSCAEQKPAAPACEGKDECGNPVVQPEIKNPCEGPKCEKKVIVEAEEKKCGEEPCAAAKAAKMTVVAATKNSTAASHPVVPKTVGACEKNSSASSCAAESKSPVSLCKPCAEKRDACHAKCEEKKCADKCHAEVAKCSCGSTSEVRTDVVKPSTEQTNGCQPNGSSACANVKPTMVKKGELTDKKAAKFFF